MKNGGRAKPEFPKTATTRFYPARNARTGKPAFQNPSPKRPKRILKTVLAVLTLVIVILGGVVVSRAVNLSDKIFVGTKLSFFQKIASVLQGTSGQTKLIGEDSGQINILLLGIGGEGHDGPYLTDTMILAQIRPEPEKWF